MGIRSNPHYDGHKASIKKLIFQYETSTSAEFTGLRNGTISVGYLPDTYWKCRNQLTGDRLSMPYVFGFNYLAPNLSSKAPGGGGTAFQQAYVRQALEMGIDQKGIISTFYHGHGIVEDSPIPSQPPTQFDDPKLAKPPFPFDPAAGKKLLEKHGWVEKNGVMTKNGVSLKFNLLYMSGDPTLADMVTLIKSERAREGVQISLTAEPFANVIGTASQSDPTKWQMAFWGGGPMSPATIRPVMASSIPAVEPIPADSPPRSWIRSFTRPPTRWALRHKPVPPWMPTSNL